MMDGHAKPFKVLVGQQFPLEVLYGGGEFKLCTVTWRCRWHFSDDQSRPRGFRVSHKFKKPGRVIARYHIKNNFDGSRMDGYMLVDVMEEYEYDQANRAPSRRQGAVLGDLSIW
jgi:hypothetical protein